jgi:hypothetical protein
MRPVSDAEAVPRDDRAWPTGAFGLSLSAGLVAFVCSALLVASAGSLVHALKLMGVFAALGCLEGVAYVDALRPWLQRQRIPPRTWLGQALIAGLALLGFSGGVAMGAAAICGVVAGMALPNASAMRVARVRRALADEDEGRLALGEPSESSPVGRPVRAGRLPQVGPILRADFEDARDQTGAWIAAVTVLAVAAGAGPVPLNILVGVIAVGMVAVAWTSRRLLGALSALRDFESASTAPRRAFVVLLENPAPRAKHPLLGVWSEEPVPSKGRLPAAEEVYRCDPEQTALISVPGGVVVHEAWLDTVPGSRARPRWVAADAGIALPQRQVVVGQRSLDSVIGGERPRRTRPLTMPVPHPTTETASAVSTRTYGEAESGTRHVARLFAWRLMGLALTGAAWWWWTDRR